MCVYMMSAIWRDRGPPRWHWNGVCEWGMERTGLQTEVSFSPSCLCVHSFAFPALPGPFEKRLEGSEFISVPNCSKLEIPWEVLEIILLC